MSFIRNDSNENQRSRPISNGMKPRLLYILPEYKKDTHTHFSYIPDFLTLLSNTFEIRLLVEKGEVPQISGLHSRRASILSIIGARLSGYRICYVHYSFGSAFVASIVFRITGGKVFYWNCGLPWEYSRPFLRDRFERLVYQLVSFVVTGTQGLAHRYAKEYHLRESKVLVMPNWIDVEGVQRTTSRVPKEEIRKQIGIVENQQMVLFAHRLSPRKGAHYLLEIAKHLPDGVVLTAVGDGPVRVRLEGKKNIIVAGWQPHAQVLSHMASSAVFIMPSDEEGFPHVLLEAMALGIPFVATNVGGVAEIVPRSFVSQLISKGDMAAFSSRLSQVLSLSPSEKAGMVREMREWVRQYDSHTVAKIFSTMIEQS